MRYIVDLQVLPLMSLPEKRKAKKYGITVITGTMNASPISPSEKHVTKILAILGNERYHPVTSIANLAAIGPLSLLRYTKCIFSECRRKRPSSIYAKPVMVLSTDGSAAD